MQNLLVLDKNREYLDKSFRVHGIEKNLLSPSISGCNEYLKFLSTFSTHSLKTVYFLNFKSDAEYKVEVVQGERFDHDKINDQLID